MCVCKEKEREGERHTISNTPLTDTCIVWTPHTLTSVQHSLLHKVRVNIMLVSQDLHSFHHLVTQVLLCPGSSE